MRKIDHCGKKLTNAVNLRSKDQCGQKTNAVKRPMRSKDKCGQKTNAVKRQKTNAVKRQMRSTAKN